MPKLTPKRFPTVWVAMHVINPDLQVPTSAYASKAEALNDGVDEDDLYEVVYYAYVRYALDDRDRVVNSWRALGLTCLQVREGDF